jgi:hypothetical protein
MEQHRELAGYRYRGSLLSVLAAALGDLQAVAPEIGVLPEGTQDVLGAADQQPPQLPVAPLRDALFTRITFARLVLALGTRPN